MSASHDSESVAHLVFSGQMFLLKAIKESRGSSPELIDALDSLEYAFRFCQNPDGTMPVCPECGGIFYQHLETRTIQCLDCDYVWAWAHGDEVRTVNWPLGCVPIVSDFTSLVTALQGALKLSHKSTSPSQHKAVLYLQHAIECVERFDRQLPARFEPSYLVRSAFSAVIT